MELQQQLEEEEQQQHGQACTHLRLCEAKRGGELGAFRKCEVLRALKASVELLQLQAAVDGPRLAHLLPLRHAEVLHARLVWGDRI